MENQNTSTCKWLVLETLGSPLIMLKDLPSQRLGCIMFDVHVVSERWNGIITYERISNPSNVKSLK